MIHRAVLAGVLTLLFPFVHLALAQQSGNAPMRRNLHDAIVRLETFTRTGGHEQIYQQGTGFVVSPSGHVLTAAHVIPHGVAPGQMTIRINRRGNDPVNLEASLVGAPDPDSDTALLLVSALGAVVPLCFGDSERLQVGSRLVKYGYPRAGQIAQITGTLSNRTGEVHPELQATGSRYWWAGGPPRRMWLMGLPLLPGDSGGPIMSEDGRVVGVACCGVPEDAYLGYMVPETAFVALRRRIGYSETDCAHAERLAANPDFTASIVGVWTGPYRCETGDGRIRMTITVGPDGRLAVHEAFQRDFRRGDHSYHDVVESKARPRSLDMRARRTAPWAEEYQLELTFDERFQTARGVYRGHRTCRAMELTRQR